MNTTKKLAAIVMFAAVLGMISFGSVFAAKADKVNVCHFEEEYINYDTNGDEVVDENDDPEGIVVPATWELINISANALKAHEGVHGDGETFDFVVDENTAIACDALINPPEV